MAAIEFESVEKVYRGGVRVLSGIDLSIERGELVTIVGPSGCGKSTLLSLIAGFEQPTAGHVKIDGTVVDDQPPQARGLAMVFQSYALYPHLDVYENIAFPLRIGRTAKDEIDRRVRETAERLGLAPLLRRRPAELSGGQRQRVALARALVRKPSICLFDEPLSNLDAALRHEMRAEIKRLHEDLGATFVYVTHDQAEAMTLSDRIIVLNAGSIEQQGPPMDVYERPVTKFVAAFLGSPSIRFVRPGALGISAGSGVIVGLRPEDVAVESEASNGAVEAVVTVVEPVGSETWVTCAVGDETLVGRAPPRFAQKRGDRVSLRFDPARAHHFDEKTGRRL
ncbi:MAG: ABC transporter ATP-binding protein [Polyangiaceae bacterium]|nr:ABC transporter ATP-binding protein [Polyangiaceae bacterium]